MAISSTKTEDNNQAVICPFSPLGLQHLLCLLSQQVNTACYKFSIYVLEITNEFHCGLLHTQEVPCHVGCDQGVNEFLTWSHTDLLRIPEYSWLNSETTHSHSFCFPFLRCPLVTFLFTGEINTAALLQLGKLSEYKADMGVKGDNSIWRLLESRNLEGSANSSCHFYSLTDGYFSYSWRPPQAAISQGPQ